MKGIGVRVFLFATTFLSLTSFLCLWLEVKYTAAQCPSATPLPSDVLPSIDDDEVTDQLAEQIANLQQTVPELFQTHQIDVYSVAVVYRNTTIYSAGMVDTPFRIASITKVFTAMGALLLRQRGLLALDDPVKKFLPTFSVKNPYGKHDITLRELMGHLSGLPRELCVGVVCGSEDEEENLRSIAKMQLARPPWSFLPTYSNLGFTVLGHAWEKATSPRQAWGEFVRDEISTPLRMHDTGVDLARVKQAPGHIGSYPSNTSRGWRGPDGEMYSTALDLAKFLKFLLHPDPELLSATTIREWTHPTTIIPIGANLSMGYALPWELLPIITSDNQSTTVITKGGGLGTYRSIIAFHPDSQLGVTVLISATATLNTTTIDPGTVMARILRDLIPAVQSIHSNIISSIYSGVYICKRSPDPIASPNIQNVTFQVLEGSINVTAMAPGKGLVSDPNITLLRNGLESRVRGPASLVLRSAREHSFWAYPGPCAAISGSLSFDPEIVRPNFPESLYSNELRFEPREKKVRWPGIGAECYM